MSQPQAPVYDWWECRDCQFSMVLRRGKPWSTDCPICAEDNLRRVSMRMRPAKPDDSPEGRDERKLAE